MSVTPFDPQRALREEMEGLSGVIVTINGLTSRAEQKMSEAEAEYNAMVKLAAFAKTEMARKRAVLRQLEEDAK